MPIHRFIATESIHGEIGWLPVTKPDFEPLWSLGIAHDVLEHNFRNEDNSMGFEFKATGVALMIREEFNLKHSSRVNQEEISKTTYASSLYGMLEFYDNQDLVPNFYACKKQIKVHNHYENMIDDIVNSILEYNDSELEDNNIPDDYIDVNNFSTKSIKLYKEKVKQFAPDWIRSGIHYAIKKYDYAMYDYQLLFNNIYETIGKLESEYRIIEKSILTVSYNKEAPNDSLVIKYNGERL